MKSVILNFCIIYLFFFKVSEEDLQPPEEEKKQTNVKEKKKRGTKGLYQTKEDVEWESK